MAVWYLDNDDEITDAVARLRGSSDERVVFVVPPGSRIATGRINFRLLAREAGARGKEMAIASADEQVRALAASAGVLVAASVEQAEAALERGDKPARPIQASDGGDVGGEEPADAATVQVKAQRRGLLAWSSQRLRIVTVTLLALALVGVFAASQTLPTATITLQPRVSALGPLELAVVALPTIAELDVAGGRIPAVTLPIPLDVGGRFSASGSETIESRASGEVVFSSPQQLAEQLIPAGTRLQTPGGVEFETTQTVTLPPTQDGASQISAPVEAILSGEDGNVPADAISVVPSLAEQGISVRNPEPTGGGRFVQSPRVTAEDYDAAAVDLQNRLAGALVAYLRDPANTPGDLTVFAETAQLGQVSYTPAFDDLVGAATAEFELSGEAVAGVLAVDDGLIDEVTRARLQAALPQDMTLLADSVKLEHGEGIAEGQGIQFEARGNAAMYPLVDADRLIERVAGLPVSEAQAILEEFGIASVNVWPGFLENLPADGDRIEFAVTEPSTTE
jgi:hypothetical protein